jgi:hypothetical protein
MDAAKALPWLEAAASAGQANAMFSLGSVYAEGLGVAADMARAYRWLSLAARRLPPNSSGQAAAREQVRKLASVIDPAVLQRLDGEVASWRPAPAKTPSIGDDDLPANR